MSLKPFSNSIEMIANSHSLSPLRYSFGNYVFFLSESIFPVLTVLISHRRNALQNTLSLRMIDIFIFPSISKKLRRLLTYLLLIFSSLQTGRAIG